MPQILEALKSKKIAEHNFLHFRHYEFKCIPATGSDW